MAKMQAIPELFPLLKISVGHIPEDLRVESVSF
ncbi:hypothetical protein SAMN05421755_104825 [Nitrosomonas sp. Nm33]|nr:hypothetical protein SAMN05421755_104825 [Nitrosomonas sp. Nm33]